MVWVLPFAASMMTTVSLASCPAPGVLVEHVVRGPLAALSCQPGRGWKHEDRLYITLNPPPKSAESKHPAPDQQDGALKGPNLAVPVLTYESFNPDEKFPGPGLPKMPVTLAATCATAQNSPAGCSTLRLIDMGAVQKRGPSSCSGC